MDSFNSGHAACKSNEFLILYRNNYLEILNILTRKREKLKRFNSLIQKMDFSQDRHMIAILFEGELHLIKVDFGKKLLIPKQRILLNSLSKTVFTSFEKNLYAIASISAQEKLITYHIYDVDKNQKTSFKEAIDA